MNYMTTFGVLISALCFSLNNTHAETEALVYAKDDGTLVYTADAQGNQIPDFSNCGYMGGGVSIPLRPVEKTLSPQEGGEDDTARIQAALDGLCAKAADKTGWRGTLLLKRGLYRVSGTLKIHASGVVLRGEGQEENGTVLLATGKVNRTLIEVFGKARVSEVEGSRRKIKTAYVPWGKNAFELESTEGLSVGDAVMVHRPSTKEWISEIKMDQIPEREGRVTQQWKAGDGFHFERKIAAISKNWIKLDAPLVQAMDEKFGGGSVYRFTEEGRINQVGIENLRLVSEYQKGKEKSDEDHAWTGIHLDHVVNAWARNITVVHFSHAVNLGRMAKYVTVQDCGYLKPVSQIKGGRRYPYAINGQFCLVQRCYSEHARHAEATGSGVRGPNVFLDCLAEHTHSDTGPHHRWAVGILWDSLKGGAFNAQDRAWMGSGHGWAGAQQVFWNCETSTICVQKPPTAQNYAIGCLGKITQGSFKGREPGHYESHGKHVDPRSLYLSQLKDRLGEQAVKNVATEEQLKGTIYEVLKERLAR